MVGYVQFASAFKGPGEAEILHGYQLEMFHGGSTFRVHRGF